MGTRRGSVLCALQETAPQPTRKVHQQPLQVVLRAFCAASWAGSWSCTVLIAGGWEGIHLSTLSAMNINHAPPCRAQEVVAAVRFAGSCEELAGPLLALVWELAVKPSAAQRTCAAAFAGALVPCLPLQQVRNTPLLMVLSSGFLCFHLLQG